MGLVFEVEGHLVVPSLLQGGADEVLVEDSLGFPDGVADEVFALEIE